jgi:hypothetical protein
VPENSPSKSTAKVSVKAATKAKSKTAAKSTAERTIVFDPSADRSAVAEQAIADPVILTALVENLSIDQRRVRQFSAAALKVVSEIAPDQLIGHIDQLSDALHRPEAQTRWECLEALSNVVALDAAACDAVVQGAEVSLYDEDSGPARLAAMRFLCAYGAHDAKRAGRVWPYIDEAIQCYHGDPEFQDMLLSVIQFASGKVGQTVKDALSERMGFDAKHSKGQLGRRAVLIVEQCSK